MEDKIAVVTGSNKGIGFAIVKELLKRDVAVVYLTSRDLNKGKEAVAELEKEGLKPELYQLEVTNEDEIKKFSEYLKDKHGHIDILINNAAVSGGFDNTVNYEDAHLVIETNYRSNLKIYKHLFPILNDKARVINVSSDCGHLFNLKNENWRETLSRKDIEIADINAFVDWFLDSVKEGTMKEADFISTQILPYRISKIALSALTVVQQREVGRDISVNTLHPGFVKTSMTHFYGHLTPEESSKTPVYMALDAPQSLKGAYVWYDKSVIDWCDRNVDFPWLAQRFDISSGIQINKIN